ncbi:cytosolic factor, phosphatidylinositol/phosphatidylcholine transfer protein [Tilletia horrida]|uniref:Cytosolic factor, phosphatidylinositol/phosphatidylcholine transfer protein n=1 Tax=Tilletia horrida TaxID=155126 RepID=A0AAN6GHH4_9BASI|nr:cytosolic factor, phosphatidylinositol/phosphatidylcholine transfer protein [Tilletia horrida]
MSGFFARSAPPSPREEQSQQQGSLGAPNMPKLTHSASTNSALLAPPSASKTLSKTASSSSLRRQLSNSAASSSAAAVGGAGAAAAGPKSPKVWAPIAGHIGNLSPAQEKAFAELRSRLSQAGLLGGDSQAASPSQRRQGSKDSSADEEEKEEGEAFPYETVMLLRFLRARQFNVDAAYEMYSKAAQWRKSVDLDRSLEEFHFAEQEAVASYGWRMYWHKTDKLGRPIFVQDLNNIDPVGVFGQCTTADRIIKRFAGTLELACRERYAACTKEAGHLVEDNFMIVSIGGLGFSTFWNMKGQLQKLLAVLDANFPELSGRVQIINAPWAFATIWSWIKGWLPVGTRDKVDIQGTDFLPTLLEWIDPASLPQSLGGNCQDCQEWMDGGREMEAMMGRLALVGGANVGDEAEDDVAHGEGLGAGRAWGAERDADSPWKKLGAEIRERRGPCKGGCERSDLGPWDRSVLRGR